MKIKSFREILRTVTARMSKDLMIQSKKIITIRMKKCQMQEKPPPMNMKTKLLLIMRKELKPMRTLDEDCNDNAENYTEGERYSDGNSASSDDYDNDNDDYDDEYD